MKDRTLENMTRMTIDGQRYRVGNPNHPYHELYVESGIEAVYDMMFKAPSEETEDPYSGIETKVALGAAILGALLVLGVALL